MVRESRALTPHLLSLMAAIRVSGEVYRLLRDFCSVFLATGQVGLGTHR